MMLDVLGLAETFLGEEEETSVADYVCSGCNRDGCKRASGGVHGGTHLTLCNCHGPALIPCIHAVDNHLQLCCQTPVRPLKAGQTHQSILGIYVHTCCGFHYYISCTNRWGVHMYGTPYPKLAICDIHWNGSNLDSIPRPQP